MRAIRFLVYLTTLAYSVVVIVTGPSLEPSQVAPSIFTSPLLGTLVGISQLLASAVGLVVDSLGKAGSKFIKAVFMVLALSFFYETSLVLITGPDPFDWIPYLVYAVLSSIVYLSEG